MARDMFRGWAERKAAGLARLTRKPRREIQILLIGMEETFMSSFLHTFKTGFAPGGASDGPPPLYRSLANSAKGVLLEIEKSHLDGADRFRQSNAEEASQIVLKHEVVIPNASTTIHMKTSTDSDYPTELCQPDSATYLQTQLLRIDKHEFTRTSSIQTDLDIMTCTIGGKPARFLDLGQPTLENRKWMRSFGGARSIIFYADISRYDERLSEDGRKTHLTQTIALFESIVNSPWFSRTWVHLYLTNVTAFKEKLQWFPLQNFFPEYPQYSGPDAQVQATAWIRRLFTEANRASRWIWTTHVSAPVMLPFVVTNTRLTMLMTPHEYR